MFTKIKQFLFVSTVSSDISEVSSVGASTGVEMLDCEV